MDYIGIILAWTDQNAYWLQACRLHYGVKLIQDNYPENGQLAANNTYKKWWARIFQQRLKEWVDGLEYDIDQGTWKHDGESVNTAKEARQSLTNFLDRYPEPGWAFKSLVSVLIKSK